MICLLSVFTPSIQEVWEVLRQRGSTRLFVGITSSDAAFPHTRKKLYYSAFKVIFPIMLIPPTFYKTRRDGQTKAYCPSLHTF